jgi:hypothetical protein
MRGGAVFLSVLSILSILFLVPNASAKRGHTATSTETSDFQRDVDTYPEALLSAGETLSGPAIQANAHVYTTLLRTGTSGDAQRAQEILDILRHSMAKYKDYRAAIADGYTPFMPKTDQHLYWFISGRNAYASAYVFNPGHPTSLLYKKSKGNYELEGAIFTAPKAATESQLNDRIPLSVGRWFEQVNLCAAPKQPASQSAGLRRFGLDGSIATKDACVAADGRWVPQVFGWMVAVFPFESSPGAIWPH